MADERNCFIAAERIDANLRISIMFPEDLIFPRIFAANGVIFSAMSASNVSSLIVNDKSAFPFKRCGKRDRLFCVVS